MIDFSRLKDIREDKDINQEKMAKILNVNRSAYSLWELGINIIPLKHLCDFADYFNFSLDYVLNLTNNRNSKNLKKGLDLQKLGKNMKDIRIKNCLSQKNVAEILGVTQPAIARIEKGIVCISIPLLYKYAKRFNISINELCGKNYKEKNNEKK